MPVPEIITNNEQHFINIKTYVAIQQVIEYHEEIEDYETCAAYHEALVKLERQLTGYTLITKALR